MFSVQNVKTFGYKLVTKVSSLYFMPGDGKKARQKCGETSPKTACPLAFRADWPWGTLYVFGSSPVNDFHFAGLAFLLRARERRTAIFHTSQPLFHRIPTSFPSLPQLSLIHIWGMGWHGTLRGGERGAFVHPIPGLYQAFGKHRTSHQGNPQLRWLWELLNPLFERFFSVRLQMDAARQ